MLPDASIVKKKDVWYITKYIVKGHIVITYAITMDEIVKYMNIQVITGLTRNSNNNCTMYAADPIHEVPRLQVNALTLF